MAGKFTYSFDPQKNAFLKEKRQISFEEIITILEKTGPLDVVNHPNIKKYPYQRMYILEVRRYIYLVPFTQESNKIFLKTAFPSRKAKKHYLNER